MNFRYQYSLSVADYLRLRKAVGWKSVSERQARAAVEHSDYLVSAEADGRAVASARLVSDGGTVFYIADVMVDPAYQGGGVGKTMVSMILAQVRAMLEDGEMVRVNLMAAVGREPFYEKQGFVRHPSDQFGAGMSYTIEK
ncbi:Acetyltransferase (GNAT) domain protein [Caprobacter fermentans]|uniref:Acetyltransferase (GNAT) domain protein n=1 Tax=Caproicibacter fermentans TaxID=2576756 RepID=A0A6N8I3V6_9FIRM|nr:GNAT family N-acetyltransferase [Caproicibacter fermentans]MVB12183.1 Acetyltransferase (GNAT) domain protein [Caproicibacter fermentans]